jgi:hypothetical protein
MKILIVNVFVKFTILICTEMCMTFLSFFKQLISHGRTNQNDIKLFLIISQFFNERRCKGVCEWNSALIKRSNGQWRLRGSEATGVGQMPAGKSADTLIWHVSSIALQRHQFSSRAELQVQLPRSEREYVGWDPRRTETYSWSSHILRLFSKSLPRGKGDQLIAVQLR